MAGKLPPELLERYVYSRIGVADPRVLVGPRLGEDAAVIDFGEESLVVHVDPITGAERWLGWLAVHVASNDVAVTGAKPRWLLPVIFLPENGEETLLDSITSQIDEAARELGEMVVGGHSEYAAGFSRPVVSMTAMGTVKRGAYVSTGGAKPGDVVVMTKTAGVEGTAILATDYRRLAEERGVGKKLLDKAAGYIRMVSVVREALAAAEAGASSMHDPTEGGVLGGLAEMALASRVLVEVWEDRIPVSEETRALCDALGLDPLKLISSGVLLLASPRERLEDVLSALESLGVEASVIGEAGRGEGVLAHRKWGDERIRGAVEDELWKLSG